MMRPPTRHSASFELDGAPILEISDRTDGPPYELFDGQAFEMPAEPVPIELPHMSDRQTPHWQGCMSSVEGQIVPCTYASPLQPSRTNVSPAMMHDISESSSPSISPLRTEFGARRLTLVTEGAYLVSPLSDCPPMSWCTTPASSQASPIKDNQQQCANRDFHGGLMTEPCFESFPLEHGPGSTYNFPYAPPSYSDSVGYAESSSKFGVGQVGEVSSEEAWAGYARDVPGPVFRDHNDHITIGNFPNSFQKQDLASMCAPNGTEFYQLQLPCSAPTPNLDSPISETEMFISGLPEIRDTALLGPNSDLTNPISASPAPQYPTYRPKSPQYRARKNTRRLPLNTKPMKSFGRASPDTSKSATPLSNNDNEVLKSIESPRPDSLPPLPCGHCDAVFNGPYQKGNRSRHLKQMHSTVLTLFECTYKSCVSVYRRADALRKHQWKKHRIQASKPDKRRGKRPP